MRSAFSLSLLSLVSVALGLTLLPGCSLLEDNGTHLAYALERGASKLRASAQEEILVRYETLDDAAEPLVRPALEIAPGAVDLPRREPEALRDVVRSAAGARHLRHRADLARERRDDRHGDRRQLLHQE